MNSKSDRAKLLLFGSLAAVFLSYLFILWLPNRREIAQLSGSIEAAKQEIANRTSREQEHDEVSDQVENLDSQSGVSQQSIPPSLNTSGFLAQVYRQGQALGIQFDQSQPDAEVRVGPLVQKTVMLTMIGSYPNIVQFVNRLEKTDRKIELSSLTIEAETGESFPGAIKATLELKLFAKPTALNQARLDRRIGS